MSVSFFAVDIVGVTDEDNPGKGTHPISSSGERSLFLWGVRFSPFLKERWMSLMDGCEWRVKGEAEVHIYLLVVSFRVLRVAE